ncbi:MAG TPA: hypothetical protein VNX46_15565 [Candidatus Acidoferrum sp.]|jgi:hypothetical protein|nr:hypothetical protein [Candidatus Acidoferrum sp.]
MNTNLNPFQTNIVRFGLCMAVLAVLTGCVGYVEGPSVGVYSEPEVFAVQDDYVYYPQYECYYSVSRHEYADRESRGWVARPAPRGVSVDVLVASPSVRMDFHDSPARHYDSVARQYPRNWHPDAPNRDQNRRDDHTQKADQKDDHHRDHNGQ